MGWVFMQNILHSTCGNSVEYFAWQFFTLLLLKSHFSLGVYSMQLLPQQWAVKMFWMGTAKNTGSFLLSKQNKQAKAGVEIFLQQTWTLFSWVPRALWQTHWTYSLLVADSLNFNEWPRLFIMSNMLVLSDGFAKDLLSNTFFDSD